MHPQFIRKERDRLVLQDRDLRILQHVRENRCSDTVLIKLHIGHAGSDWAIQSRLGRLFNNQFLDRPPQQLALRLNGEVSHLVYTLGSKGAEVLADRFDSPLNSRRWTQKNKEIREKFILHSLGINRFRTCLSLAVPDEANGNDVADYSRPYLLTWLSEEDLRSVMRSDKMISPTYRCLPNPDAYFGIQKPKTEPNRSFFFVEYQRSTPDQKRFINSKAEAYRRYFTAQLQERQLGIRGFRVLVVTPTEKRMNTLREYTASWLKCQPTKLSSLWLFTSEERFSLSNPTSVLEPVWTTANDECDIAPFI